MPASEARLAANRKNAELSTGPRTPEGKAVSRANALKHGLTGAGVALPDEDAAEIGRRFEVMQAELRPASEVGRFLVQHAALMMVRLERCARHEAAATSERVERAASDFDEARFLEARAAVGAIAIDPELHARRLRRTPEGVDRLILAFLELRDGLADPARIRWDMNRVQRFENLTGRPAENPQATRAGLLGKAIWAGGPLPEAAHLAEPDRREWARLRMVELIDVEVAGLREARAGIDLEAIDRDRAGAPGRALFDPSKEATLARKYEAAAERGLYRALRQLEQAEAKAEATPAPEVEGEGEVLGSFFPAATPPPPIPDRPAPGPSRMTARPSVGSPARPPSPFNGVGQGSD